MSNTHDRDVEQLLRGGVRVSPGHKEALRARLFAEKAELSLDDLEKVTGGAAQEKLPDTFEPWPEENGGLKWP